MESLRTSIRRCMTSVLGQVFETVPDVCWETVQEIRVRAGAPLMFSSASENVSFGGTVTAQQVWECFLQFCGHAVHTHQDELRQGFITTREGVRVGIAGTAVMSDGDVASYRDITSLCIRVPRAVPGCADTVLPYIESDGRLHGMLLCGAPASGKTTMLRDAAQTLSVKHRIAVIDERRELTLDGLCGCDVLIGCPKAGGILQAVRTLAPDAVIADEIGDAAEWRAVEHSVYSGVPVIASVHASCIQDLTVRAEIVRTLGNGGFEYVAFLPPRRDPGGQTVVRKAAEWIEDSRGVVDHAGVYGSRCGGSTSADGG